MYPRGKVLKNVEPKSVFCVQKQDGLYTDWERRPVKLILGHES